MEHAAVVARLVASHGGLLFEDGDAGRRVTLAKTVRGGKADDATPDDEDALGSQLIIVTESNLRLRRTATHLINGVAIYPIVQSHIWADD